MSHLVLVEELGWSTGTERRARWIIQRALPALRGVAYSWVSSRVLQGLSHVKFDGVAGLLGRRVDGSFVKMMNE